MADKHTTLTFAVTVPQPKGATIKDVRENIIEALREDWKVQFGQEPEVLKAHLLNKETHYGKR